MPLFDRSEIRVFHIADNVATFNPLEVPRPRFTLHSLILIMQRINFYMNITATTIIIIYFTEQYGAKRLKSFSYDKSQENIK